MTRTAPDRRRRHRRRHGRPLARPRVPHRPDRLRHRRPAHPAGRRSPTSTRSSPGFTAERYGFERAETSWEAIVEADDIDAVSIVVANHLHREIAEALLASGKHVLCEKPLAPSVEDARAMVAAAEQAPGLVAATGFSYRRAPAIAAIAEQVRGGGLGQVLSFNGRYWCDYGATRTGPTSWRYTGPVGSGALADIGSHLIDAASSCAARSHASPAPYSRP